MGNDTEFDKYEPHPYEKPLRNPPVINGRLQPHEYEYGGFEVMGDCGRCGHVRESPIHVKPE